MHFYGAASFPYIVLSPVVSSGPSHAGVIYSLGHSTLSSILKGE